MSEVIHELFCGPCLRKISHKVYNGYICDCTNIKERKDCLEFYDKGYQINGIYKLHQNYKKVILVYCDQSTDGGGWTVFQRRMDGSVNFNQNWSTYLMGFGELDGSHWLGNRNLFTKTFQIGKKGNELRVEVEDWKGVVKFAKYDSFGIESEDRNFRLFVSGYSGNAGDSLSYHNEMAFTTKDNDNDPYENVNCGRYAKGGWWYKHCFYANLNGLYVNANSHNGIIWKSFLGFNHQLKYCEMKVRRKK